MCHKPMCCLVVLLVIIGGLNWGLVGLGNFLNMNLNLVNLLLGSWPTVEWIVYILVGLAAIVKLVVFFKYSDKCPCKQQ